MDKLLRERIYAALNGARFVWFTDNMQVVFVWMGTPTIRVYSGISWLEVDVWNVGDCVNNPNIEQIRESVMKHILDYYPETRQGVPRETP